MEELSNISTMLQMLQQPAFRVEGGVISHVNQAANACFLQPGQPFAPMLLTGADEYAEFTSGSLYVTLSVAGQSCGAFVTKLDAADIVSLDRPAQMPQLQAFALAAKALREPLNGILSLSDQFLGAAAQQSESMKTQASQINQRLHQLLRIVGNMSDAVDYAQAQEGWMECVELGSFLREILEKTAALAVHPDMQLEWELPQEAVFILADPEKLERAIYNMLSNAIKFAEKGSAVHVKLMHKGKRVLLCVSNRHNAQQGHIYSRFLREPALEDPRNGIGLGMMLVHTTAVQHGGAVLVEHGEASTRVTMTLPIYTGGTQLRSPVLRFDYAGERDHCLMELSDVLPASVYTPNQIN